MQIASTANESSVATAGTRGPIPGWTPTIKAAIPASTRATGLIRGGIDAWRGVPERAGGVRLSDAMVGALTPFFAARMQLDPNVVRQDLSKVRIVVSGPAHDAGGTATTIGHAIYVSDASRAVKMLGWDGRRWLVHELVHTMQWRKSGGPGQSDTARDRSFLNTYLGKFLADEGSIARGGLVTALREWLRRQQAHEHGVGDAIHDAHPMEREAEQLGVAFRDLTA